jgi:hypothetical protein
MPTDKVPSIGRIVHYKLESGPSRGQLRPAIIVRVWAEPGSATPQTAVQLQVFTDAANDGLQPVEWRTSRTQGDQEGNWQWPAYVAPVLLENTG